ncbi:MAG: hypothetical protein KGZ58_11310 [Ignavibacteriales bacterium]|nr:hypothetical protein [Ignavibacteriales bacterium]
MLSHKIIKLLIISFVCTVVVFTFPKVREVFTGQEDHKITSQEATQLIQNFRKDIPEGAVLGHFVGRDAVLDLLYQAECVGMRVYNGKHDDGSPALVIVGVDKNGNDIKNGLYLQRTFPCPPFCGDTIIRPDYSDEVATTGISPQQ